MPDEASIKIILVGEGGAGGSGGGGGRTPPTPPPGGPPRPPAAPKAASQSGILDELADLLRQFGGALGKLAGSVLDLVGLLRRPPPPATGGAPSKPGLPQPPGAPPAPAPFWPTPGVPPAVTPPGVPPAPPSGRPPAPTGAGAGGSIMSDLAATLGIFALVLVAFKALSAVVNGTIASLGSLGATIADANESAAHNLQSLGQTAQKASDAIFLISPPLSVFGSALGEASRALGEVMGALDGMVDRFAQFSPQLAVAQARGEVTQFLGDLRRAQEATPALRRYIEERTRLQQQLEDTKVRLMTRMLPTIIRIMQVTEVSLTVLEVIAAADPITRGILSLLPKLEDIRDSVDALREQDKDFTLFSDFILNQTGFDPFAKGGFTPSQPTQE